MIPITQVERGLCRWVDAEIIAKLPTTGQYDGAKKVAVAASAVYLIRKGRTALMSLQSGFLSTIGMIDAEGNIDIEGVKEVLAEKIPDTGIRMTVPILNEITLYKTDIESMYSYIMGG